MYSTIHELPSQVLACLDDIDAKAWMDIYNATMEEDIPNLSEEEKVYKATVKAWMNTRELPSAFSVEEWATVEAPDRDDEIVTLDAVEQHVGKFIKYGGEMMDTHSNLPLGVVWHAERRQHPDTGKDGIVVFYNMRGGTYETDLGRKRWLNGLNKLSIGASATVDGMECDATRCYTKRGVRDLYEISLCEEPANPYAEPIEVFEGRVNKATEKQTEDKPLILKSLDTTSYLDAEHCTTQKVCKLLRDYVTTPHERIVKDGRVKVYTDDVTQLSLIEDMRKCGLIYDYDLKDDGFNVRHGTDTYYRRKSECMTKDYIDMNYVITDKMPQDMFAKLYKDDMIHKSNGTWKLVEPLDMEAKLGTDVEKSEGAMTGGTAGASNPHYGGIDYRTINQFVSNRMDKIHTEKGIVPGKYWMELYYGKKITITSWQDKYHDVEIKGDKDELLTMWSKMLNNDDYVDVLYNLYK